MDPGGDALWPIDGVLLCSHTNDAIDPRIASDGSGGAIVTWKDYRSLTSWDIYAQWIDAKGTTQWKADGIRLCGASDDQDQPQIVSDGSGGAIVAWRDARGSDEDIYAQRVGNVSGVYLPLAVKQYE